MKTVTSSLKNHVNIQELFNWLKMPLKQLNRQQEIQPILLHMDKRCYCQSIINHVYMHQCSPFCTNEYSKLLKQKPSNYICCEENKQRFNQCQSLPHVHIKRKKTFDKAAYLGLSNSYSQKVKHSSRQSEHKQFHRWFMKGSVPGRFSFPFTVQKSPWRCMNYWFVCVGRITQKLYSTDNHYMWWEGRAWTKEDDITHRCVLFHIVRSFCGS